MKLILIFVACLFLASCLHEKNNKEDFSFVITADMRNFSGDNKDYYRGACEAIKELDSIEFIVSPGDIDPPDSVFYTMQKYIRKDIIWYPIVGNHEAETTADMEWLRNFNKSGNSLPYIVNKGPLSCIESTYSFDFWNTHFIILNEYATDTCDDCTDGDIPDYLFNWLQNDLQKTKKKNILVFGHEPAYPLPDIENQRYRHTSDCLNHHPDNRDRFVKLLEEYKVIGYFVGHTHNYSIAKINRLWHIDAGHARGLGDTGARSTFIKINISKVGVGYQTYRLNYTDGKYEISDFGSLN